jgi:pyruvate dehydrogenase (quinone)
MSEKPTRTALVPCHLRFVALFPSPTATAWQEALSSDRPVVLEVKTDPEVAPMPPHITLKEARSFMSAMAKGDRGAGRVIGDTARQVVDGLFGGKKD